MSEPEISPKMQEILKNCTIEIVKKFIDSMADYAENLPDVKENNKIFFDTIIAGAFANIILLRTDHATLDYKIKYTKEILNHVQDAVKRDIIQGLQEDV